MAIRDRIMSSNMRQPFREDVLRPMPMPMPILPPAPRQPLPLPMLPPVMPPRREDFLSIQRLDDPIVRPLPVGPSIPFVPPGPPQVTPVDIPAPVLPGVGLNNFGGTPLGQQPIVMDSGPQTTGISTLKDTRDYANMTDDEIRKIMGPNPTVPGRSPKPISQEQIDEFRFDKLNPGMLFEMIQNRDISPDDYDDPLAKKIATRLQESERKRREFFENNPVTPPVAPPPPDGTPENPFPLQPILPGPIDTPAPVLPDPRGSIGRPAPILPDPRDSIGRPLPPIPIDIPAPVLPGVNIDPTLTSPGRRIPPMATPADFIPRNDKTTGYDELQEKIGGSRLRFPPPEDFGFGPGIRPTEIRDEQGNIIVGSGGVTPPGRGREPFVPPQQPPRVPLSERTDVYGAGKRFDPANLPEGFSFEDNSGMIRDMGMPPAGFVYAYGPDGERRAVPSGAPGAAELREQGAARDQAYLDFQKTNPGEVFFGGLRPPPDPIVEPDPTPDPTPDPVTTPAPVTPPEPVVEPEPTPTEPMQPINVSNQDPFAASVTQQQVGLDPLTEQLLFGIGGQGGFIPGAMRAAEKVFYDDQGNPVVIDEQVAGFSPDQLQAMQMQRQALGIQNPFLQGAGQAFGAGTQALEEGLQRGRTAAIGSLQATRGGVGSLQSGLGESADILRGTLGGYDPSMTSQFYDPFEDRVVQQTIEDIMEQGARSDIGARASDIARGGESAFGSRARLGASERQEAIGRGLAEALGGIRSRGFQQAQQTGLGEFARQRAAERAASSGLASLAGQGFGGSQALAGALSGLGQTEQDIGQQRYSGQFGLGTGLQGLGAQAAGASASDIAALYGMGAQQQGQAQQMLDAQRRNLQQRQMTPLLQYQALAPFISMAPAGQFQTRTQFAPPPSAMQSGLSTGLAAFGALGKLYGGSD